MAGVRKMGPTENGGPLKRFIRIGGHLSGFCQGHLSGFVMFKTDRHAQKITAVKNYSNYNSSQLPKYASYYDDFGTVGKLRI